MFIYVDFVSNLRFVIRKRRLFKREQTISVYIYEYAETKKARFCAGITSCV